MKYAIIKKADAENIGIQVKYHKENGVHIIINEKELMYSKAVGRTLEDKAKSANAELIELSQALRIIK